MADTSPLDSYEPYPLAIYNGERPPAPAWFHDAVATPYTMRSVAVDGAEVTYQQWGSADKPGLLLVHGSGAHAHWYDFIAPSFIDKFNVAAMTFSGMGDSGWRDAYSVDLFSKEQMAVIEHAGFLDHAEKPKIVAHSFGGVVTLSTIATQGSLFSGAVIMDTPIFPPDHARKPTTPKPRTADKFFEDQGAALARFRLLPPQPCENHFILDHIARHSLKQVDRNGTQKWIWKFDPTLWEKVGELKLAQWDLLRNVPCKLAFMRGQDSILVTDAIRDGMLRQADVPFPSIPGAQHHLFLDKPLDTVAALKTIIEDWGIEP